MNEREKIRQNLASLSRRGRYENTLRAFLSEDNTSHTMGLGDERPSEVKYLMDDLISKKGWQNKITVLEHSGSVILINQQKGRARETGVKGSGTGTHRFPTWGIPAFPEPQVSLVFPEASEGHHQFRATLDACLRIEVAAGKVNPINVSRKSL
jgi:hypothetical protein